MQRGSAAYAINQAMLLTEAHLPRGIPPLETGSENLAHTCEDADFAFVRPLKRSKFRLLLPLPLPRSGENTFSQI